MKPSNPQVEGTGQQRAATFEVTVENVQNRRRATYLGGPGRAWIAAFLEDLIAGTFGQP
jgi:hypothetical protein